MFLEDIAPVAERAKTFARGRGLASIAAQIRQRLFAFENRGDCLLTETRPVGGDIGSVAALRQSDFRRAGRITVRLRPKKREPFEPQMRFRLGSARGYWRVNSASSLAQ